MTKVIIQQRVCDNRCIINNRSSIDELDGNDVMRHLVRRSNLTDFNHLTFKNVLVVSVHLNLILLLITNSTEFEVLYNYTIT